MKLRRRIVFLVALGQVIAMVVGGCKVTSHDIERWKKTQKGPDKLAAVLLDERYLPELRAQAAWSLAQIGQWEKYDKAFKVIEEPSRTKVIEALVPLLVQGVKEGNRPPSPPIASQVAAKDALFVILPYTSGAAKTQAEDTLIEWCVADFNGRFFAGRYSIEVVLTTVGPRAADAMADLLRPGFPAYDKVSEILTKIGTPEAKEKAGRGLVQMARERQGRVEEQLLVAMGRMGGKEVRSLLLELGANLKIPAKVQRGALMAYLQFNLCNKEDAELLFQIAEDINQDYMARNFAYDAIVCTGEKAFIPRLYKLLHEKGKDKDKFRGVGVDEILKLGGPEAIPGVIQEIVAEKDPWESFENLRDFVAFRFTQDSSGRTVQGEQRKAVLQQLRPLLESKEAMARGLVILALGVVGEPSDIELLKRYTADRGKLTNWKSKEGEIIGEGGQIQKIEAMNFATVGDVASWAIKEISKRQKP